MGGGRDVFEIATKTMKESCKKCNSTRDRNIATEVKEYAT
jgi:hypothetical protein